MTRRILWTLGCVALIVEGNGLGQVAAMLAFHQHLHSEAAWKLVACLGGIPGAAVGYAIVYFWWVYCLKLRRPELSR